MRFKFIPKFIVENVIQTLLHFRRSTKHIFTFSIIHLFFYFRNLSIIPISYIFIQFILIQWWIESTFCTPFIQRRLTSNFIRFFRMRTTFNTTILGKQCTLATNPFNWLITILMSTFRFLLNTHSHSLQCFNQTITVVITMLKIIYNYRIRHTLKKDIILYIFQYDIIIDFCYRTLPLNEISNSIFWYNSLTTMYITILIAFTFSTSTSCDISFR